MKTKPRFDILCWSSSGIRQNGKCYTQKLVCGQQHKSNEESVWQRRKVKLFFFVQLTLPFGDRTENFCFGFFPMLHTNIIIRKNEVHQIVLIYANVNLVERSYSIRGSLRQEDGV